MWDKVRNLIAAEYHRRLQLGAQGPNAWDKLRNLIAVLASVGASLPW